MTTPRFELIVHGLMKLGTSRENAERLARRQLGSAGVVESPQSPQPPAPARAIVFPIGFRLPWSVLVSDNDKYGAIGNRLILTTEYRTAKKAIAGFAREFLAKKFGDVDPVAFPLSLSALVWVPDDTRAHDVANFAKCCHDALEGVIYTKDRWLYRVLWERAGVDIDAPCAVIKIKPYLPTLPTL